MEDYFDLIDQYLLGRMSATEAQAFEARVAKEPALANALEQQRQAIQLLEINRDIQLKDQLKAIHQNTIAQSNPPNTSPTRSIVPMRRVLIGIAATIALLLIAYFLLPLNQSPTQLYASNYQPYSITIGARGQSIPQALTQASTLYQQGQYEAALPIFQSIADTSQNTLLSLSIGLCQLALERPTAAITTLKSIQNDPLYGEPAQWYLALAYLKLEDITNSKSALQAIQPNTEFYDQAQDLLKEL